MESLVEFARRWLDEYKKFENSKISEADTIEKFIVPIIERIIDYPIEIERASRNGRSKSRRWDLQVSNRDTQKLLCVMECKSLNDKPVCRRATQNLVEKRKKEGDKTLNAEGDALYQVWLYSRSEKFKSEKFNDGDNFLLSNGKFWFVFKKDVIKEDDLFQRIDFENKVNCPLECLKDEILTAIKFVTKPSSTSDEELVADWMAAFQELRKALVGVSFD